MKLTARAITKIDAIHWILNGVGEVEKLTADCDVNFEKLSVPLNVDIYPYLTDDDKEILRILMNKVLELSTKEIVTDELKIP